MMAPQRPDSIMETPLPRIWAPLLLRASVREGVLAVRSAADVTRLVSGRTVRAIGVEVLLRAADPVTDEAALTAPPSLRPWLLAATCWVIDGADGSGELLHLAVRVDGAPAREAVGAILSLPAPVIALHAKRLLHAAWSLGLEQAPARLYDVEVVTACIDLGRHHMSGDARRTGDMKATVAAKRSLAGLCLRHGLTVPPASPLGPEAPWTPPPRSGEWGLVAITAAARAESTLRVAVAQQQAIADQGIAFHLRAVELPGVVAFARMEWAGVRVSSEAVRALRRDTPRAIASLRAQLSDQGIEPPFDDRAVIDWLKDRGEELSPDANEVGLADGALKVLGHRLPAMAALRALRRLQEVVNGRWLGQAANASTAVRLHPRHVQVGCATGRSSCQAPNLTAIPRALRALVVPAPGKVFFTADYAQFEIGVAAALHRDPALMALYNGGDDLYVRLAQRSLPDLTPAARSLDAATFKALLPEKRAWMKQVALAALYGAGTRTMGSQLGLSTEDAGLLREGFLAAFPNLRAGLEGSARTAQERGSVRIVSGLVRHAAATAEPSWKVRNWGLNTPIQGAAAVVFKLAVAAIDRAFSGTACALVLPLHDGVLVECLPADLPFATAAVQAAMVEAMRTVFADLQPRVEVDTSSPNAWGPRSALDAYLFPAT